MYVFCVIFVNKQQNHCLQILMGNDEKRLLQLRTAIREWITNSQKENKSGDGILHLMIGMCARSEWVEELRLAVNIPRSPVELCVE